MRLNLNLIFTVRETTETTEAGIKTCHRHVIFRHLDIVDPCKLSTSKHTSRDIEQRRIKRSNSQRKLLYVRSRNKIVFAINAYA